MPDRRYSEDEVAAIFRAATELPEPADTPATGVPAAGLTLAEVQAIGLEAGIGAEAIARAAQLVTSPPVVSQRVLGLPFRVSHTVPLHRRLTDAEWERLVVQLREVFDARGTVHVEGSLRGWTNGNLHVLLEPAEDGHQLRFRTVNGGAQAGTTLGLMFLGVAGVTTAATLLSGTLANATTGIAVMGFAGLGLLASAAVRLPRWARTRAGQMVALGARLTAPTAGATLPRVTGDGEPGGG